MATRRNRSWATAAGCAVLGLVSASCAAGDPSAPAAEQFHVSLVGKDTVTTFLNRLATTDGQVVVTRATVDGARQSVALGEEPGASLHLVEGPLPAAPLPGERARVGGIAVVAVPAGLEPHDWLGSHRYHAEPIAETEVVLSGARGRQGAPAPAGRRAAFEGDAADVRIDAEFLQARLKELSGAVPVTLGGRTVTLRERGSENGRSLARAWLRQQYEALGFTVQEHPYRSGWSQGVNVTADKPGADPSRVLILSAHYDSVSNAGADDDGSGVVSSLAIARALKDARLSIGLRVVAFDQEETGLLGSKAYASMLDRNGQLDQVVGVLDLEMTGYDSNDDGRYHVIHCNENTSSELAALVESAAARGELRLTRVDACTNRSDHAAFWRYGTPSVAVSQNFFGDDGNPCYHARCDTVDRLNWDYMRRLTQAVALAAADLLIE
ncbi:MULTISPECIES: M28 family metallopeptidase [Sorangium]|uniref:M28 family metallopeptidase n=1 Tax=Sorangium TaxID=39643 RepID=UPI001019F631|nr:MULTISPECIES: M28 family metallopeptidase [Sorangium]